MKIVKLGFLLVMFLGLLFLGLQGCSKVPAGYKGVIVNLYGSDKGVSEKTVGVGRYWLGLNKQIFLFPTFLQNYTWTDDQMISMQTSEGLSVKTDVGITYNISEENVVKVFQKYREGIKEITNTFLRNMVRDAMNKVAASLSIEELYGIRKSEFMEKVNDIVKKESGKDGINIDRVYLVGSFDLPVTVIESINSKIQASQNAMKVENEVATAKAEAQKTIIEAQARAESNKIVSESLTPEFIQYQTIQKWNGSLPKMTTSSIPFINTTGVYNDK